MQQIPIFGFVAIHTTTDCVDAGLEEPDPLKGHHYPTGILKNDL